MNTTKVRKPFLMFALAVAAFYVMPKHAIAGSDQAPAESGGVPAIVNSNDAANVSKVPYEPEREPTKGPAKFPPDLLNKPPTVHPHEEYARPILPTFEAHRRIPYVEGGGDSRSLDVIVPKNALPGGKKFPVVVWIHGGGWSAGNGGWRSARDGGPGGHFMPLIDDGLAVVAINYRLSGEAKWPAQIYDCKAAIRWVRAHGSEYNLDTKKIGVWGGSAGGHLVALLGTSNGVKALEGGEGNLDKSSDVQAVSDWYGPTDLERIVQHPGGGQNAVVQFLGGTDPTVAKAASPITYVTSKAPPFLIVHGDKDALVPVGQSQLLADALKKQGVDVTLKIVEGAGHGRGFSPSDYSGVADFFKHHLQ